MLRVPSIYVVRKNRKGYNMSAENSRFYSRKNLRILHIHVNVITLIGRNFSRNVSRVSFIQRNNSILV